MVRSMIRPATTTPAETSRGNPSRRPLAKPPSYPNAPLDSIETTSLAAIHARVAASSCQPCSRCLRLRLHRTRRVPDDETIQPERRGSHASGRHWGEIERQPTRTWPKWRGQDGSTQPPECKPYARNQRLFFFHGLSPTHVNVLMGHLPILCTGVRNGYNIVGLGNGVGPSKERLIWVIRAKKTKARRKCKRRQSLARRTNAKRRKKRRAARCQSQEVQPTSMFVRVGSVSARQGNAKRPS